MADCMEFPNDWAKFLEDYSFCDHKEFYTNGARLISTFRVEQMMDHYLRKATEDSVEVVRCKDCKHAVDYPFMADSQKLVCTKSVNWRAVEPDHFCSYGERKDNERKAD